MAYNTKPIVTDKDGNPISQYFNPFTDSYEAVEGNKGANKVTLYNADGSENTGLSLLPILDKLSQLTGTVIDEETRKDNELQRIAFYNQLQQMLASGEFKGDKGDRGIQGETGKGLQFNWQGTQLGVRVEGESNYVYVDLKGDTGTIDNLTSQHVIDALGYTPLNETRVLTDVPANAKFTDTVTTINNKTGTITKADIVALGIPAQDTVYVHPGSGTNPHGTTKADVGLSNVDNVKQMPLTNGTLETYTEKLVTLSGTSPTINLSQANTFTHSLTGNTTYSISNAKAQAHSFTLLITQGATVRTVTFPANIKWAGKEIPDLTETNTTYVLTFVSIDGGTNWIGMFGGGA